MKKTQIESVRSWLKQNSSVVPSHLSLNVNGHLMSFESFCRHLRTLHRQGEVKQVKIENGRVKYNWIKPVEEEPTKEELNNLQPLQFSL